MKAGSSVGHLTQFHFGEKHRSRAFTDSHSEGKLSRDKVNIELRSELKSVVRIPSKTPAARTTPGGPAGSMGPKEARVSPGSDKEGACLTSDLAGKFPFVQYRNKEWGEMGWGQGTVGLGGDAGQGQERGQEGPQQVLPCRGLQLVFPAMPVLGGSLPWRGSPSGHFLTI